MEILSPGSGTMIISVMGASSSQAQKWPSLTWVAFGFLRCMS